MEFQTSLGFLSIRIISNEPALLPQPSPPDILCAFTPERSLAKRFPVVPGLAGTINAKPLFTNMTPEQVEEIDADKLPVVETFLTDGETYPLNVVVKDAVQLPRTLHKSIFGTEEGMPKPSRSNGFVVFKFTGTTKQKWGGYLTVVGIEQALQSPGFLAFCNGSYA